eukprot:403361596
MSNSLKLLQEIQNEILKAKNMGTSKLDMPYHSNTTNSELNLSNSVDLNPQQMKSSFKQHLKENQQHNNYEQKFEQKHQKNDLKSKSVLVENKAQNQSSQNSLHNQEHKIGQKESGRLQSYQEYTVGKDNNQRFKSRVKSNANNYENSGDYINSHQDTLQSPPTALQSTQHQHLLSNLNSSYNLGSFDALNNQSQQQQQQYHTTHEFDVYGVSQQVNGGGGANNIIHNNHNRYFSQQQQEQQQNQQYIPSDVSTNKLLASPQFSQVTHNHINSNVFDSSTGEMYQYNEATTKNMVNNKFTNPVSQIQGVPTQGLKSDQMFTQISSSLAAMKDDLERECDDISNKIDEIMRTELLTFDKLKDIEVSSVNFHDNNINSISSPTHQNSHKKAKSQINSNQFSSNINHQNIGRDQQNILMCKSQNQGVRKQAFDNNTGVVQNYEMNDYESDSSDDGNLDDVEVHQQFDQYQQQFNSIGDDDDI